MNKAQAITAVNTLNKIKGLLAKNGLLSSHNKFNNRTTNHSKNFIKATILDVYPPKKSISAIHYQSAYKMIHFKDYKTENEKKDCINILHKLQPYRDECLLNLKICTKSHPAPLYVHCYSASKYSDVPDIHNLVKYVDDSFSTGNVVQLKVVKNNLFTYIKKMADNNIE